MPVFQDTIYDSLSMDSIESWGDNDSFSKAKRFFHDGSVLSFRIHGNGCSCKVAEDALYKVNIDLSSGSVSGECSCGRAACSHQVAALLTMRSKLPPKKEAPVPGVVKYFQDYFNFVAHPRQCARNYPLP